MKGYVLVTVESGKLAKVLAALRNVQGVACAEAVCGPFDIVVVAEAPDLNALGRLVAERVQAIDGVERTMTCPVAEL